MRGMLPKRLRKARRGDRRAMRAMKIAAGRGW